MMIQKLGRILSGPNRWLFGYFSVPFLYQVNLFETLHKEQNTVNLIVRADPTIGLRREWWMSFSKRPRKNTPQCYTKPLDSLKNWNNRFFWVDERVFPTVVDWRTHAPKDEMPSANTYSRSDVAVLNTRRTPIQKQPEILLCLMGLSQRYYLGDDVYSTFLHDDDRDVDLFNLISAPNPSKVKTGLRPRATHEVLLLTATASQVIDMEDPDAATESSGTPSAADKSPLDFDNENSASSMTEGKGPEDQAQVTMAPEIPLPGNMPAAGVASESTRGGKSLPMMGLAAGATFITPADTKGVNDPDPLSYAEPQPHPEQSMTQSYEIPIENVATMEVQDTRSAKSAGSEKLTSSPSMVGSSGEIYQPRWGVTNSCRLPRC
nr:hypothetical protein [Tanacetum cinerariifolium]